MVSDQASPWVLSRRRGRLVAHRSDGLIAIGIRALAHHDEAAARSVAGPTPRHPSMRPPKET